MIIRAGDRYVNLANIKYTSELNSSYITLYFNDSTDLKITGTKDIQRVYEVLEAVQFKPPGGFKDEI
jgi:hypothetical protein